jgi:hypothetical protein
MKMEVGERTFLTCRAIDICFMQFLGRKCMSAIEIVFLAKFVLNSITNEFDDKPLYF